MSLPLMGQYAISLFTWLMFYLLIEHMGERALAISNLMRNLFSFTGIFIWAFASATNTMVSLSVGQGRQKDVIGIIKRITELSFTLAFMLFLIININPGWFLEIFGLSGSFIESGIPVLRMVSLGILFQSVSVIWLNGLTGIGKTTINLMAEFAAIIFYGIYVYLVIEVYQLNLVWAWASEIIYWLIILIFSAAYIFSKRWMNYSI
jgi:Na+-driven multidrug efflux pump